MLEIGSLVNGKYRILDIIGEGGMSIVYLARNESTKISWAIKEIKKFDEDDNEIKRNTLIAEIEMLKKLKNDYLPKIIDVINENDTMLIVMDLIEGNDLDVKMTEEGGALPQEDVIRWAKQICNVLNYLHHCTPPIIYRDMKPGNIMLKPDNNISVIDFGTAREVEIKNVKNTKSMGTEGYAAPEQYGENAYADERTDIYNFGATIFHLITGHYPDPVRVCEHPIREYNPSLSGGIESIIIKCTQLDPNKRYQNCDELAYDLENYEYIDEAVISSNKRKIYKFAATAASAVICTLIALFGYFKNADQIHANYDKYIKSERYEEAIKLDDTRIEGYEGLINSCAKDGIIDDNDVKTISVLEAYEDLGKNGNGEEISPISDLAKKNISNYISVCYQVGNEYWDKYKTPSSSAGKAATWFKRILPDNYIDVRYQEFSNGDSYTISVSGQEYNVSIGDNSDITLREFQVALVGAQISNCKDKISSLSGNQSGLGSFSGEDEKIKAYQDLWNQLLTLKDIAREISDEQLTIMLCNEICLGLEDNLDGIAKHNDLEKIEKIETQLLNPMSDMSKELTNQTSRESLQQKISYLSKYISEYYGDLK